MYDKQLQICSYEQAVALKRAGFDWDCFHAYRLVDNELGKAGCLVDYQGGNTSPEYAIAPPVSLALKWCRDVKGFDYSIIEGRLPFEYSYNLLNGKRAVLHIKGYEEAESALLDEILTLIEQSK